MERPGSPAAKFLSGGIGKILAALLLLGLAVGGGWEAYRVSKVHLALRQAHREFARQWYVRAEYWTRSALKVNARNTEALRLMAEINEAQDDPAALGWRLKVVQREPGNFVDVMAWARCALRFGQAERARGILKTLPPAQTNRNADYQELMAGCALAAHQMDLAEKDFQMAVEIDPGNAFHRMNLASFRLANSESPEVRAVAARDLEGMLDNERVNLFAARALLSDAVLRGDRERAQRFAQKLHSVPGHDFADELSWLGTLMATSAFHPALQEVEQVAVASPMLTAKLGDWLNACGMAADTVRWSCTFPDKVRATIPVQICTAEAYLALGAWKPLEALLTSANWAGGEFLRRAMLIRCRRELSQPWEADWGELVTAAEASSPDALLLAELVLGWKWRPEALDVLWQAAAKPATGSKALELLWNLYTETNETSELRRVAQAQIDIDPSNPAKKNNFAFLSLLLYGGSERAERLAREASLTDPKVPEWAATYAYALHLDGNEAAAENVMNALSPAALARPGVALYYAIVLAANGNGARARDCLAKLNPGGMLPEEQKLAADLAHQLNVANR